ncbi:MAG: LacI family transcriptional regulator [Chloroflexi bacterium]|nr:LacI family transcriptional regulator [Chloroflexota bacterium]
MKRWTLEDIGKLAGVSRSTVSRVINDHPHTSPAVRQRVEQVIRETGYQPNSAARSLASSQSRILGLVMPSLLQSAFADPYYALVIQAISQACIQHDYTPSLFLFQNAAEEAKMSQRLASSGLIDGLIVTADTIDSQFVQMIQPYDIPFVQIGRPQRETASCIIYLDVDNEPGANLAGSHLLQQGYRRIGQIATLHNTAGQDRDAGFRRALNDRGLPIDEALIALSSFSEASGYRAMQHLLPRQPEAVFAQSDAIALGAIRAIRDSDLRVPEDIAVVGFDDMPLAASSSPPLTTVRQPIARAGKLAVETLLDIIQTSPQPARHIVLPVELVIRASSGAVS